MARPTMREIEDMFAQVYIMGDPYVVKFLSAVIASSHMKQTDPIWPFLIASSGSMKTELITSLNKVDACHAITTFTGKTLISGAKAANGKETSLLIKLQDGVLVIEDFTVIMSESRDEKNTIFGQLRSVYGGKFDKQFGTGDHVSWEGKITIIAGTTHEIHRFREGYNQLGERFINYNLILPKGDEPMRRAADNQTSWKMRDHRSGIQQALQDYHATFKLPDDPPVIPKPLKLELERLSKFATLSRTSVPRDMFSPGKDITGGTHPEQPTRFNAQLNVLAQSLICLNIYDGMPAELTAKDEDILRKVAMDSTSDNRRTVLRELAKYPVVYTSGLAVKKGWPTNTARRYCEDLNALGILEREKHGGSKGDAWILKDEYREIISKYDGVAMRGYDLTEESAEEGPPPEPLPPEVKDAEQGLWS